MVCRLSDKGNLTVASDEKVKAPTLTTPSRTLEATMAVKFLSNCQSKLAMLTLESARITMSSGMLHGEIRECVDLIRKSNKIPVMQGKKYPLWEDLDGNPILNSLYS